MAWWEGGGGSWGGKEVSWWATDRLMRGLTVTLARFPLAPAVNLLDTGRQRGVGLQWRASVV